MNEYDEKCVDLIEFCLEARLYKFSGCEDLCRLYLSCKHFLPELMTAMEKQIEIFYKEFGNYVGTRITETITSIWWKHKDEKN